MPSAWTYGVRDAKAWPVSVDSGTTFTVGTALDIGGIQTVEYAPEDGDTAELNGDDMVLARRVSAGAKIVNITYAGLVSELAPLFDATVISTGTVPNQKITVAENPNPLPGDFMITAYAVGENQADVQLTLFKAKTSGRFPAASLTGDDWLVTTFPMTVSQTVTPIKLGASDSAVKRSVAWTVLTGTQRDANAQGTNPIVP